MTSLRIRHCPASPYVFLVAIQGNLQQFRGREMYQHGTSQLHRIPNANLSTTPQTDGHGLQLSEDVGMVTWAVWQVVSDSEAGWGRPERGHGVACAQQRSGIPVGTGVCRVLSALCGVCVVTWVVWQVVSNSEAGWWRPERPWRGLCSAQQQHTSGIRCV